VKKLVLFFFAIAALCILVATFCTAQNQTYSFPCPGPGWCGWSVRESPISGQVDAVSNTGVVSIQSLATTFLLGNREWLTWDGVFASSVTAEFSFAGDEGWTGWTEPFSDNKFGLCHPLSHAAIAEDAMYCVAIGDEAKCIGVPDTVMGQPPKASRTHADYTEVDDLMNDALVLRRLMNPPLPMNQRRTLTLTVDTPGQVGIWMAVAPRKSCIPAGVNRRFETYQVQAQ
jgi:hypothetical protein